MSDDKNNASNIVLFVDDFLSKANFPVLFSSLATTPITLRVHMEKNKISKTLEDFTQKSEDFLNTKIDVTAEVDPIIRKLRKLINFLDENPITDKFLKTQTLSYPHYIDYELDNIQKLRQAIKEYGGEADFDDFSDEQNVSLFYWIMKSILQINQISNQDYLCLANTFVSSDDVQDAVNTFNNDYVRPYFINPIRSYISSL